MNSRWIVHKFGGTSLADAEAFRRVAGIVSSKSGARRAVVVSAMSHVTDCLLRLVRLASCRDAAYTGELEQLRERQLGVIRELCGGDAGELARRVENDVQDIADVLRAIWLMRTQPESALDLVAGFGELWSSRTLAAFVSGSSGSATWLDAREVLRVEITGTTAVVDWEHSRKAVEAWAARSHEDLVVIPGFIASDPEGLPVTLGRNGSDYSASIFGSLLGAEAIHIWTDVDGVLSADPARVPEAEVLKELSYDEAMELAYFGAKVIHPSTMAPAVERRTPIFIRNTFRPDAPGTKIHESSGVDQSVKGFATISDMALINVEGTGMIGVPGISERLFSALREAGVSVVMISQGSSEHSICFAVPAAQAELARAAVERAFFAERHHGQIQTVRVEKPCAILAIVGDNMVGTPGIAAKFFGSLGKAGVNVRAIAQGASERNISIVIDENDATRALRAAHAGFYLSNQTLSVGIIGTGVVGSALLSQLHDQVDALRSERKIDLRIRGISNSVRMVLTDRPVALGEWREQLLARATEKNLDAFADHIQTDSIPHAVLIDCTASDEVAACYDGWLNRGIHVITPNKKANSGDLASYDRLRASSRSMKMHYLYETTVGAGLPVLMTLRDLIQTGDDILRIEGVLSGTLSYLFNSFDGKKPFSEILREARDKGFTEPDPREDLSGMDVARKVVILAREMGLRLSLDDLEIDSLVPEGLQSGSVDDFMREIPGRDETMNGLLGEARAAGQVLRFVGVVDPEGRSSVRLRRYDWTHPMARIRLMDNIVQFTTRRYRDSPLVVQGPGAGPDVTAGGIFADLLRLATYLGATL